MHSFKAMEITDSTERRKLSDVHISHNEGLQSSCCQKVFSSHVKTEIRHIFQLGWPTVLANVCQLLLTLQSVLFCGSIGKTELAAGSLSISVYHVFGLSVAIGLTSALDTLCAQAFGAKSFKMVGVVLQRGICVLSIPMVMVAALWMLTEHFLVLIRMGSELAKMSDTFIIILTPVLPACFGVQLFIKYLQTQGIVRPIVLVGLVTNVVALGFNFLMVKGLNQGFEGIAVALVIANYVQLILLLMYIIFSKAYKKTWKGWSIECLYDWNEFVGLAVPGMVMICLEWWTFEIGSFLMGLFGENTLAAQGVLLQITTLAFMIPLGISVAAGVLVGNYLGANNPVKAKLVTKLSLLATFICTFVFVITVLSTKKYIAMAFSENENIIELITSTVPYMLFFSFLDSLQGVCSGIIRGCGRQKIGMVINFISYDMVAIPLAIILAFIVNLRLTGLWLGISAGLFVQASLYLTMLACTNWNKQSRLAIARTQREHELSPSSLNGAVLHLERQEITVSDLHIVEQSLDKHENGDVSLLEKSTSECNEKQENGDGCLLEKHDADHLPTPLVISKSASVHDLETLHLWCHPDVKFSEPSRTSTTARRHVMSTKKLICIRSIPCIIALLLLCSTICVRLFVPLPAGHGNYGNNTISNQTVAINRTLPGN